MDRKVLNKAVYVEAHRRNLKAIDCDNGNEIFKSQTNMSYITFFKSIGLFMLQSRPNHNFQIKPKLPFKAAIVIDYKDEKIEIDIKLVLQLI